MIYSDRFNIHFPEEVVAKNIQRLSNQIWKCIPMRENDEDWKKQLDTVELEVVGLNEMFMSQQFLQLLSKLEGLRIKETTFEFYRKTIFEILSLLQELNRNGRL